MACPHVHCCFHSHTQSPETALLSQHNQSMLPNEDQCFVPKTRECIAVRSDLTKLNSQTFRGLVIKSIVKAFVFVVHLVTICMYAVWCNDKVTNRALSPKLSKVKVSSELSFFFLDDNYLHESSTYLVLPCSGPKVDRLWSQENLVRWKQMWFSFGDGWLTPEN